MSKLTRVTVIICECGRGMPHVAVESNTDGDFIMAHSVAEEFKRLDRNNDIHRFLSERRSMENGQKKIVLEVREVYGQQAFYPGCDMSRLIAECAGTKTLTKRVIAALERAGYAVEYVAPTVKSLRGEAKVNV